MNKKFLYSPLSIKKQKADLEEKLESSQRENKKLQEQVEHLSAKKTENITTFSTRNIQPLWIEIQRLRESIEC